MFCIFFIFFFTMIPATYSFFFSFASHLTHSFSLFISLSPLFTFFLLINFFFFFLLSLFIFFSPFPSLFINFLSLFSSFPFLFFCFPSLLINYFPFVSSSIYSFFSPFLLCSHISFPYFFCIILIHAHHIFIPTFLLFMLAHILLYQCETVKNLISTLIYSQSIFFSLFFFPLDVISINYTRRKLEIFTCECIIIFFLPILQCIFLFSMLARISIKAIMTGARPAVMDVISFILA